jgi:predicted amidophosphoribosyltransferase
VAVAVEKLRLTVTAHRHTAEVLDLILPLECGGCGAPATRWCDTCAKELLVAADEPQVVNPRIDPEVPVFALGRYAGARRQAILAMKERGRGDLVAPLGRVLAVGVHRLLVWGMVETPLTIVPAPTRRWAARRRGGDPVSRVAELARVSLAAVAGHPEISVVRALRMRALARDSVGLTTSARERNVAGRVLLRATVPRTEVVVVDDIVTTGATARESVRVLQDAGTRVAAVLTIAFA